MAWQHEEVPQYKHEAYAECNSLAEEPRGNEAKNQENYHYVLCTVACDVALNSSTDVSFR